MTTQLRVGPHSSSSLIRSDSVFETGSITFNTGISVLSTADNSIETNGGIIATGITATNLFLSGTTQTFIIGDPSHTINQDFPELGMTSYNDKILLGISSQTFISDAIQQTGEWLSAYLVDTPPAAVLGTTGIDGEKISVSWTNPPQLDMGLLDINIPVINEVIIQYVQSSLKFDTWFR